MIKAEWTNNDALSTGQTTYSNAHNTLNALDCVSRQYAIEHYQHVCRRTACKECPLHIQVTDTLTDCELELFLHNLPSAQPEIIRCKDCAWWQREWSDEKDYHYCTMEDDRTYKEFYCANAERREE